MEIVVLKEVEHNATPAEKAAMGVGYSISLPVLKGKHKTKNVKAMGDSKPIVATEMDIHGALKSAAREVRRPPTKTMVTRPK